MPQNTTGLIKGWSVVVGVLSLSSLLTLSVYPIGSPTGILSVLAIIFGLAVAYVGVQVSTMSVGTVNGVFWTKFVLLVINLLLSFASGQTNPVRIVIILAQGAIVWYLIVSLKKLHSQPQTPAAQ
jgi:hypothetical protein